MFDLNLMLMLFLKLIEQSLNLSSSVTTKPFVIDEFEDDNVTDVLLVIFALTVAFVTEVRPTCSWVIKSMIFFCS